MTLPPERETVHGTCVALDGRAVLLRGPSGAGKSDLAYRLVKEEGAHLVADDRVSLAAGQDNLVVHAQEGWAGLLELRGLGIVTLESMQSAPLVLIVDLVHRNEVPRLAEPRHETLCGHLLPVLRLHAFDVTAPAKVALALSVLPEKGFPDETGRFG
ncbi:MAG: aldolase [Parvibaculaceae bacterium]